MDRLVRNGQYYRLNGQQLFNKINSVLALCEHEPLTDPAAAAQVRPEPGGSLRHHRHRRRHFALKLSVSGTPAEDIMVFASPPLECGPGLLRRFPLSRAAAGSR